ncbi:hypothetical protein EYV94_23380 [Puteibacter caeruleilacunae]|nr:hypothetical protein EYV94_23380 [Puteibacter caeruleilacunae]
MKQLNFLLSLVIILTTIISCNNQPAKPIQVDPGFGEYVTAFTTGVISAKAPLQIKLAEETEKEIMAGQEIEEQLFKLTPQVDGKAYWKDARTIEFHPSEKLVSGRQYKADFMLGKLLEVESKYEKLSFSFQVIRQSFSVTGEGLQTYDKQDMGTQNFKGYITTADVIADQEIEKVMKAEYDGQEMPVQWTHAADGKQHHFVVDSLVRKDVEGVLKVSWEGDPIGLSEEGELEVKVPALNVFKVLNALVVQKPEQYLSIRFSDALQKGQDLKGLIRLQDYSDFKFIIDGNELKAYPKRRLSGNKELSVEQGVRNAMDYPLYKSTTMMVTFEDIKPAVRLIGKGVISPSSQGLILPFEAVSLKAVDLRVIEIFEKNILSFFQDNRMNNSGELRKFGRLILQKKLNLGENQAVDLRKWNAHTIDIAKYIDVHPGAIYRVELRFRKAYSLYGCGDEETDENLTNMEELAAQQELEDEMQEWDQPGWYSSYYNPRGYRWNERRNPCHVSYYNSDHFVSRNIFASDLGIIAKEGNDHTLTCAVSNLLTVAPESGVTLEIYNYQNQLMASGKTSNDGLTEIKLDRKPYLLVAKKGDQRGYLRLDDGSALSLSNFDVGGQVVQKGIKGYIYGERGVWRPGDKIYLTFVLEDENEVLPNNHPVIFELRNPEGQVVKHKVSTKGVNGFYAFTTSTDPEAPTGNWNARIKVGGATFTKRIKVETVKPNRLKINLDFGTEMLEAGKAEQQTTMDVKWLHGATARNMKANISLRLSPRKTSFEGYPRYQFDDPAKSFYADEQVVFDGKIDQNGKAVVKLNVKGNSSAPGMLNANFVTRVFEAGGDYSIDMQRIPYAPYNAFVGMRLPESDNGWFLTDKDHEVEVATVDPEGNPLTRKELMVKVYKIDWRWWWDSDDENLASYIGRSSTRVVSQQVISSQMGKAKFKLNIAYNNWRDYGRYLIRVMDPESGHSAGVTAYFSKWYGVTPEGMPGQATVLSFSADKKKYQVGEQATVKIPSSKQGKALVSIETGAKVLNAFWVDTEAKETKFSFKVTPDMAPNAYVHVSLVQPHAQVENDLPVRMYGVIPIMVEDPATRLNPSVKVADVIEPEKKFEVKVAETNGKKMTYTVAVVDDGLLDLTRFKTPNPWNTFYAREALGVKSWDMYDLVMGAFGARLEKAFAVGGDENLRGKKDAKANRFKPVVMFYGPYTLEAGDSKVHQFTMPNYVGSVRTMVVAGDQGAYGSAEQTSKVRKPLMVLATLPRVLGPGESVKLPVTVFAMDPKVKDVKVRIESNEYLQITGEQQKNIKFTEVGEQVVDFDLKVASKLGIGKVKVIAESNGDKATYDIELDVRNPNPRVVNMVDTILKAGQSWEHMVKLPGMKGTNKGVLEISSIPPVDFGRRLEYLIGYPHGCIEQTTSAVFPQLFLQTVVELTSEQKVKIEENVRAGLNRLMSFQLANGGFSYWPGRDEPSDWGTSYAGHFMLKAEEKGYTLPIGLKSAWLRYQKNAAQSWEPSMFRGGYFYRRNDLMQAYRLYTLALAGSPDLGSMNRLRERSDLTDAAKWRLAATYQIIGQKAVAVKLITDLSKEVKAYREHWGTFGSALRDRAMILETLSLMDRKTEAFPIVQKISAELSRDRWMSTQTTAYCLIAMSEFAGQGDQGRLSFKYALNGGAAKELTSDRPVYQVPLEVATGETKVNISNRSEGILYARVMTSGIPETGDKTAASSNLILQVKYTDMNGKAIDVSKLTQGTDFMAEVTIKNPGTMNDYEQMALTQIFPSGWEIVNTRFGDIDEEKQEDQPTYQDIRDDRVYTYFNINKQKVKTFSVALNASYVGRYYLPTVSCDAMYDDRIHARKPGQWIEVVKE